MCPCIGAKWIEFTCSCWWWCCCCFLQFVGAAFEMWTLQCNLSTPMKIYIQTFFFLSPSILIFLSFSCSRSFDLHVVFFLFPFAISSIKPYFVYNALLNRAFVYISRVKLANKNLNSIRGQNICDNYVNEDRKRIMGRS